MDKEFLLQNAIEIMADRYKAAQTPELELGADLFAVRIKKKLIKDGCTEAEAEAARLKAKFSH
ncbi:MULTISPECIES: hypothetical protein [unclassified Paenibacillus]|uniref:hypothetical protein n=1 Tax=unclassified Paenibacillus TaxID=185978 RepID=UPI0036396F21